jgi:hypothetical protein
VHTPAHRALLVTSASLSRLNSCAQQQRQHRAARSPAPRSPCGQAANDDLPRPQLLGGCPFEGLVRTRTRRAYVPTSSSYRYSLMKLYSCSTSYVRPYMIVATPAPRTQAPLYDCTWYSRASAKPALSHALSGSIGSLAAESPAEISQLQIRQPSALARQGSKSPICAALGYGTAVQLYAETRSRKSSRSIHRDRIFFRTSVGYPPGFFLAACAG